MHKTKADRKKVGALADAIAFMNRYHVPGSDAYQHKNPGLLLDKYTSETRTFITSMDGFKALMDSLYSYCEEYPSHTIEELVSLYGCTADIGIILDFLDVADENILNTKLSYFYGVI